MLYSDDTSSILEKEYQKDRKARVALRNPKGYEVNFASMEQVKLSTSFTRKVRRVVVDDDSSAGGSTEIDLSDVEVGDSLPMDLEGEAQIVLVKGDVVQVSKMRTQDKWAFGTKVSSFVFFPIFFAMSSMMISACRRNGLRNFKTAIVSLRNCL